jgi:hypothetical protein
MTGHGSFPSPPIDMVLADDPDLWLATADMRAWSEAHPCTCEGVCKCDVGDGEDQGEEGET